MPERFDSYLAQVDEQIRWPRVRPALRRELMGHLEEQRDACLAEGMDESSAEVEAVRQMGDPVLIGQQLDAVHRPRPQYAPLALAAILAICGALIRIHIGGASPARSIAAAALGFLLLLVAYFSDYRRLVRYGGWLYLATVVLGYAARQWWPWIFQSGFLFQYVALLFPLAGALAACALRGKRWGFWLSGLAYGLLLWLSYRMTYALGTLLLILCGAMMMLAAIRQNWWPVRKKPAAALVITVSAAALAVLTWARWDTLLFALGLDTQYYYPFTFSDTVVRQVLELAPNWGSADLPLGLTQSFEYLNFTSDASDYLLTLLISQLGRTLPAAVRRLCASADPPLRPLPAAAPGQRRCAGRGGIPDPGGAVCQQRALQLRHSPLCGLFPLRDGQPQHRHRPGAAGRGPVGIPAGRLPRGLAPDTLTRIKRKSSDGRTSFS